MRIVQIGAGMLGSIFATEAAKRMYGHGFLPAHWRFVDDGIIEARNCSNQNFVPIQEGENKAEMLRLQIEDAMGVESASYGDEWRRLDEGNAASICADADLIVDAVDNVPTRQLIWAQGITLGVPVLHMGVSREGTGVVEWTLNPVQDSFGLGPLAVNAVAQADKDVREGPKLKPCELLAHRLIGLMVGHTAARALGLMLSFDPEKAFPEHEGLGVVTSWHVTTEGARCTQLWER